MKESTLIGDRDIWCLVEQRDEWAVAERRYLGEESMALLDQHLEVNAAPTDAALPAAYGRPPKPRVTDRLPPHHGTRSGGATTPAPIVQFCTGTASAHPVVGRQLLSQTAAMLIREIGRDHRAAAVQIWSDTGLTRPWNEPNGDFDRAIGGSTSAVLGALEDDTLVGTVMVGHDGHRGWVYYLAVSPERQRRGLARLLMDAAESWLAGAGAVKLNLMVRRSNTVALGFYELLGYADAEVTVLAKWLQPRTPGQQRT